MEILQQKVRITLGDSSVWELPYDFSEFTESFNYAEFEFLNTQGALVDRKEAKAVRYNLTVYFNDVDHLITANNFRNSTLDKRPWLVEHPFNGTRNMQPIEIKYDNTSVAHTTVSISLVETILDDGVLINQDPKSVIIAGAENLNDLNNDESAELIADSQSEMNNLVDTANQINTELKDKISFQDIADSYNDVFSKMNSAVGSFGSDPLVVMQQISNMLLMPKDFIDNINDRLQFVKSQFAEFYNLVKSLPTIYTAQYLGASVISAYTVTAIPNEDGEYQSALDVDNVVSELWSMFVDYTTLLQQQQVNGFLPSYGIASAVYEQVVMTIKNLYSVALELPTVVEIRIPNDTVPVILAHKYGMDFEQMFKLNNWSVAETLIIQKDTPFKYYI